LYGETGDVFGIARQVVFPGRCAVISVGNRRVAPIMPTAFNAHNGSGSPLVISYDKIREIRTSHATIVDPPGHRREVRCPEPGGNLDRVLRSVLSASKEEINRMEHGWQAQQRAKRAKQAKRAKRNGGSIQARYGLRGKACS
jgi:hypothetical protein